MASVATAIGRTEAIWMAARRETCEVVLQKFMASSVMFDFLSAMGA
jgi:hypothetical protein